MIDSTAPEATPFGPSLPPDLDGLPSAGSELPEFDAGRPYAMPSDLLAERYGPLFYGEFSGARRLYACSLELVDELCDEERFVKNPTKPLARVRPLVGDGLFSAFHGEPNWQKARDVLLPGFGFTGVRGYHAAMLDINDRLVRKWDATVGKSPVDVSMDLQKLAMDTVGFALMGTQFDSFSYDGFAPIPESFLAASAALPPEGDPRVFERERARLYAFIDDLIEQHQNGVTASDDLVTLMLAPGPEGQPALDLQNTRNQILTILIAGQLTTSELMPMALFNLLRNPVVLHRIQAEVDAAFGTDDDRIPAFEEIGKLTYLRQAIDESLRLSPPAASFDRMALADTVIGGKYLIKEGEAVTVLVGALHRQPQWGDNVELFDPDRFAPEQVANRPTGLFKPFGTGIRSCIGRQFALHEAALALARVVHRYRFLDSGNYVLKMGDKTKRQPFGFQIELVRRTPAEREHNSRALPAQSALPSASADRPMAVAAGTAVAVLHGSNLGTCRALAKVFAEELTDLGCTTTVGPLDSFAATSPTAAVTVIVASSYNGQPTDDAREFLSWITESKGLDGSPLYAVFGVGDRNWVDTYQAVPRRVDERLSELGGQRLLPLAEADTSSDLAGAVEEFTAALTTALAERFGDASAPAPRETAEPLYSVRRVVGPVTSAIDARFDVVPMMVLENHELVSADNPLGQAKRHIRISLPEGIDYHTGDHLTVLADNPAELVQLVLDHFHIDPDLRLSINPRRKSSRLIALDREVTNRELLTHFVELRKPATPNQLRQLAASNPCPPERERLQRLADGTEASVLSPLECLVEFPACNITGEQAIELLEPMTPRHYSIASSSRLYPRTVGLVVSVLAEPARSGYGLFRGVASNYLANVQPGQHIRARVDQARQAFRSGADPSKNVILVSAGTGVAPFCGFLGDRFAAKQAGEPFAPALCFFGVRHPDVDYIFREQFEAADSEGIVSMRPAFSRAPQEGIRYVQDRIAASADEIWELIGDPDNDTHIYVCGDGAKMAPAVRQVFIDIYRSRTGASEQQSRDWLINEVTSDRYVEDVWAQ